MEIIQKVTKMSNKNLINQNHNNFTFQFRKLGVDCITFKFQQLDDSRRIQIANYLLPRGFNSYQVEVPSTGKEKEVFLRTLENRFEVSFVNNDPYWSGTLLQFTGSNAQRFYFLAKEKVIDWNLFSSAIFSQFNLYFDRYIKVSETHLIKDFFNASKNYLDQREITSMLSINEQGYLVTIGSRRSNNYSKIYSKNNSLRFELEMKDTLLDSYSFLLVSSQFLEFEHKIYFYFIRNFASLLPLEYSFLDWLVIQLRPMRNQMISSKSLRSDYIQSQIKTDPIKLLMLLQFLNYAQHSDFEIDYLGEISYRVVSFYLYDFLKSQKLPYNQYQLKKAKDFLDNLQTGIVLTSFTDTYFQSLAAVPQVKFVKVNKFYVAKVWLVEELFYYNYPFVLPDFSSLSIGKLTKHELQVQAHILQVFSSVSIDKKFFIKEFLDSYPSILSNQDRTVIKKLFLNYICILKERNLIESKVKIISNQTQKEFLLTTDQLTSSNISEGFIIYEKISLSSSNSSPSSRNIISNDD